MILIIETILSWIGFGLVILFVLVLGLAGVVR